MRKLSSKLAGQQSGFTLIELVIVIVIIGILAAVAIPNFSNLSDDAKKAKADATAGALASWASTNYARCAGNLSGSKSGDPCSANGLTAAGLSGTFGGSGTSAPSTTPLCTVQVDGQTSSLVLVRIAVSGGSNCTAI